MTNLLVPGWAKITQNPIFQLDQRRLSIHRAPQRLWRYNRVWLRRMFLLLTVLWVGWWAWRLLNAPSYVAPADIPSQASQEYATALFFLAIIMTITLDFSSIQVSASVISRERADGRWALLRITTLDPRSVIAAKHLLAQLRTWRVLVMAVSVRLMILIVGVVQYTLLPDFTGETALMQDLQRGAFGRVTFWLNMVLFGLLTLTLIIEPFWRMRTVTALGTWVSAQVSGDTNTQLAGAGMIALMWITQGLILVGWFWLTTQIFEALIQLLTPNTIILLAIGLVLLLIGVIYGYYRLLRWYSLRRATKAAFR